MRSAVEMGAEDIAFLAGKYDPARVEEHYQALCRSTREIYNYVAGRMNVNLEVFDTDVEKCSLIGPAPLALRYAREMRAEYANMADPSHITQLRETFDQSLSGKAVIGVARHAKRQGRPVIAVVGGASSGLQAAYDEGVTAVFSLCREPMTLRQSMEQARGNLYEVMQNIVRALLSVKQS